MCETEKPEQAPTKTYPVGGDVVRIFGLVFRGLVSNDSDDETAKARTATNVAVLDFTESNMMMMMQISVVEEAKERRRNVHKKSKARTF
jgi:hypothetical protein